MTHQKRLPAPGHYSIERKQNSYVSTIKGSRPKNNAVPAVLVLRDMLGYAESEKEAKQIIRQGDLLRNGERVRDIQDGIGVLDVIELPKSEEAFRVIRRGKYLALEETEDTRTAAKITGKTNAGDHFVYHLHNGENYSSKDSYSTDSTLLISDSVEEVKMEEGTKVLAIEGKHAGETGELTEIIEGGQNPDSVTIENNHEFKTREDKIIAIGDLEV